MTVIERWIETGIYVFDQIDLFGWPGAKQKVIEKLSLSFRDDEPRIVVSELSQRLVDIANNFREMDDDDFVHALSLAIELRILSLVVPTGEMEQAAHAHGAWKKITAHNRAKYDREVRKMSYATLLRGWPFESE